jgi:hypothetical protein
LRGGDSNLEDIHKKIEKTIEVVKGELTTEMKATKDQLEEALNEKLRKASQELDLSTHLEQIKEDISKKLEKANDDMNSLIEQQIEEKLSKSTFQEGQRERIDSLMNDMLSQYKDAKSPMSKEQVSNHFK